MEKIDIKKTCLFILFVILTLSCLYVFFDNNYGDGVLEYTMVHAFVNGNIPYIDINTVVPPFFIFFYSPFIFIYDDMLTMLIINSILTVIMFYLIYKMLGNKWLLMLGICSLSFFLVYFPGYNNLTFFLIILVLYLEHKKSNDYLIGLILGLILFTKHSVGLPIIIMSFLYLKNFEKIKKRSISILGVCLFFLIYFLIAGNLYQFIDLCFLGLFDFTGNSHYASIFYLSLFLLNIIFIIYKIIKTHNFMYYYALGGVFFSIPIINWWHFVFSLSLTVLAFLYNFDLKDKYIKLYKCISILFFVLLFLANVCLRVEKLNLYSDAVLLNENHFKFYPVRRDLSEFITFMNSKYNEHENVKILGEYGALIKTINDDKFDYFDFFFIGNFGYNGTDKMINKVKNTKDTYYIIYEPYDIKTGQLDTKLVKYITDNSKYVESFWRYKVYYKE